jgi:DNA polymerase III psi subunit
MSDPGFNLVDNKAFRYIFTETIYKIGEDEGKPSDAKDIIVVLPSKEEYSKYEELLYKVLQAVNLSDSEIQFLYKENASSIALMNYKILFSFGLQGKEIGLSHLNDLAVMREDNKTYLFTHTLSELDKDIEKKKILWANLKKLFKS